MKSLGSRFLLAAWWLAVPAAAADLAAALAEPNLEKRSDKAMQNAGRALDAARKAYMEGQMEKVLAALQEVSDSVDLCRESLRQTGKSGRRSPKYFKRAEQNLRKLLRRLDTFKLEMSVDERPPVEKVIGRAHAAHEEILQSIMGKR